MPIFGPKVPFITSDGNIYCIHVKTGIKIHNMSDF